MNVKKEEHKGGSNPSGFDAIVREVFAPIYPVIAKQIVEKTTCHTGICLDAGCGTGALGRAFAHLTQMDLVFFDQSNEMLDLSKKYTDEESLTHRSSFIEGDIHAIPFNEETIDLVISRGSSPFWEDWDKAYSEILRVLKKGSHAYIGGGFGSAKLRDEITATMEQRNPNWRKSFKDKVHQERENLPQILKRLNPHSYEIINDESGFWVFITK